LYWRTTADAFVRTDDGSPAERTIDLPAHRSAWCSVLGAAALYSAGSLQVIKDCRIVSGQHRLRINPRFGRAPPETLAVSDDGAYLLYSTGGTDRGRRSGRR
jgi:hypothetical protein